MNMIWTNEGGDRSMNNPLNWREGDDVWNPTGSHRLPLAADRIVGYVATGPTSGTCLATFAMDTHGGDNLEIANCTLGAVDVTGGSGIVVLKSVTVLGDFHVTSGYMIASATPADRCTVMGNAHIDSGDIQNTTVRGNLLFQANGTEQLLTTTVHGSATINTPGGMDGLVCYGPAIVTEGYGVTRCKFYGDLTIAVRYDAPFSFSLANTFKRLRMVGAAGDSGWLYGPGALAPSVGPNRIGPSKE